MNIKEKAFASYHNYFCNHLYNSLFRRGRQSFFSMFLLNYVGKSYMSALSS